jgi:hypothetical protein
MGLFLKIWIRAGPLAFIAGWALGVARLAWPALAPCFAVVFFPFSLVFLWLERQTTLWWQSFFPAWVNDEIGQFLAFFAMILGQAAVWTLLVAAWIWRRGKPPAVFSGTGAGGARFGQGRPGSR